MLPLSRGEFAFMFWTDKETRELVSLWPRASAAQIARRLRRPRSAVVGKVKRLRQEGALPHVVKKHFDLPPVPARLSRVPKVAPKPLPPLNGSVPPLDMQPCSFLELDATRCHWPLGEVTAVAADFCGATVSSGQSYCPHHLRLARG